MSVYYTIRQIIGRNRAHLVAVGIIGVVCLLIYLTNLPGDFWLSGWDNLHPELNFRANLNRAFFSAWQEYQGLGLPAGHGHAAELWRELVLAAASWVVTSQVIRKLYVASMLLVGGLGVYFFLQRFIFARQEKLSKLLFSLTGAFFYLFSLATVQIFYIPYEAFVTHYGLLPWMIYSLFFCLRSNSRIAFAFLAVVNLLGSAQFYLPTLFFVYLFIVLVILLEFKLSPAVRLRKVTAVLALIVTVNLPWLLPFIYYSTSNISSQTEAHLNYLYSEDIYLKQAQFGSFGDTVLLKGFLFDAVDLKADGKYDYMARAWIEHLEERHIRLIGYVLFAFVLLGAVGFIRRRNLLSFVVLLALFFSLLAVNVFPLNILEKFLRSLPLFAQVFRNPFTKFANSLLFFEASFFAYGIYTASNNIVGLFRADRQQYVLGLIVGTILLFQVGYIYPAFQGQFIYRKARVTLPPEYFQLFAFFKDKGDGRIANLPQFTPSGWSYYRWGYGGSGFLWYGIRQPILDRAFDVWQKSNENYYWEITNAIYSGDRKQFSSLLDKYQIQWLVVDENIVSPSSDKALYLAELEEMISSLSAKLSLSASFGSIKIYRVDLNREVDSYVYMADALPEVNSYRWGDYDRAYFEVGDYVSNVQRSAFKTEGRRQVYYPFRSLFTGRKQEDIEFTVKEKATYFSFIAKLPPETVGGSLLLTDYSNEVTVGSLELFVGGRRVWLQDEGSGVSLPAINSEILEVRVAKDKAKIYNRQDAVLDTAALQPRSCDQFNQGVYQQDLVEIESEIYLRLTSIDSSNCVSFNLPSLPQTDSFLITVKSSFGDGKTLSLVLLNNYSTRPEIITALPKQRGVTNSVFVVPARDPLGAGYTLHFDNQSIGQKMTVNNLGEIAVYKIPYDFLTRIKVVGNNGRINKNDMHVHSKFINPITVKHPNPSLYEVSFDRSVVSSDNLTLVLSQSYDKGWRAFFIPNYLPRRQAGELRITNYAEKLLPFIFGEPVGEHVLINNWANGWKIDPVKFAAQTNGAGNLTMQQFNNLTIVIVYLPQYLQYLGFGLLLVVPLIVLKYSRERV